MLRNAARYASDLEAIFVSHCEDDDLKGDAVMNEGASSARLGLAAARASRKTSSSRAICSIAEDTGKPWHIAHVSTATSLDLMRWARSRGVRATCEVTPHHLLLLDDRFDHYRADAKVNPPLRAERDRQALIAGVQRRHDRRVRDRSRAARTR